MQNFLLTTNVWPLFLSTGFLRGTEVDFIYRPIIDHFRLLFLRNHRPNLEWKWTKRLKHLWRKYFTILSQGKCHLMSCRPPCIRCLVFTRKAFLKISENSLQKPALEFCLSKVAGLYFVVGPEYRCLPVLQNFQNS